MGVWIADEERGLLHDKGRVDISPTGLCACGNTVVCACAGAAHTFAADTGSALERFPLPPDTRKMCALPGALYCLSGEADSLSLLCPRTGRLRLCVCAGCYPRDVCLSPCGRLLAVAGGADGAVLVMKSADLSLIRRIRLPGIACAVAFQGAEICALCAVEENDIATRLMRVSVRGVTSEAGRMRGLPGALTALPDGGIMTASLGEIIRFRKDGRVVQRLAAWLPSRLRLTGGCVLSADPLEGTLVSIPLNMEKPAAIYRGGSVNDVLVT